MNEQQKIRSQAFRLFLNGDIKEGEKIMDENNLDYLEVSPNDKWNWLHQLLMGFTENKPSIDAIKFFIDKGVPVNAQDGYGKTPLMYAMRSKNTEAAMLLLENGADPNIPDKKNEYPLSSIGAMPNRIELLKLMLEKGADVHKTDRGAGTMLEGYDPNKYGDDSTKEIYEIMKKYS